MSAERVLRELAAAGVHVTLAPPDGLNLDMPRLDTDTRERILAEVRRHKPEIVAALRTAESPARPARDHGAGKPYLVQRRDPTTGQWVDEYRAPDPFLALPVDELLRQMETLGFQVQHDHGRIVVTGDWPEQARETCRKALEPRQAEVLEALRWRQ